MKRSELKVGDVLYYTRSRDWEDTAHGGHKATVVDTQSYRTFGRGYYYGPIPETWKPDPKGTGVLVDIHDGQSSYRDVVPLSSLKGPYDELAAHVAQRAEAKDARASNRDTVLARAEKAGIKATRARQTTHPEEYVMLPVDELARILDRLEE